MISKRLLPYVSKLEKLQSKSRLRSLGQDVGADFTSNDYLGLASSPRIRARLTAALEQGVPVGAGGSRLLRGNHAEHEALEAEAAGFFRSPRALYFGSGYAANLAVLSTLPQPGDLIVHDLFVHASAREGMRAGRATAVPVQHNDVDAIDRAIRSWRQSGGVGVPWIVVESLYSMDGDLAPLEDLSSVADRHEAFLYIDEAHATGVHGDGGRGRASALEGRENVITLHTCGKALGCAGALVGASEILRTFLINRARPFIYATAPSPLQAIAVREALAIVADEPERRERLLDLVSLANRRFTERLGQPGSGTQILPVIVGESARALRIAKQMQAAGFDIRAVRPPTVPAGTARLRITVTLNVDGSTVEEMIEQLAELLQGEAR